MSVFVFLDPKFVRAYENPRFVPAKGGAPVPAQVAPGGDIAKVRDDDRLPDDSFQGLSRPFTGLLVAGQPVRARYCGVCAGQGDSTTSVADPQHNVNNLCNVLSASPE